MFVWEASHSLGLTFPSTHVQHKMERFLCKLREERGKSGVVQERNYIGGVVYSYWLSIWGV